MNLCCLLSVLSCPEGYTIVPLEQVVMFLYLGTRTSTFVHEYYDFLSNYSTWTTGNGIKYMIGLFCLFATSWCDFINMQVGDKWCEKEKVGYLQSITVNHVWPYNYKMYEE